MHKMRNRPLGDLFRLPAAPARNLFLQLKINVEMLGMKLLVLLVLVVAMSHALPPKPAAEVAQHGNTLRLNNPFAR